MTNLIFWVNYPFKNYNREPTFSNSNILFNAMKWIWCLFRPDCKLGRSHILKRRHDGQSRNCTGWNSNRWALITACAFELFCTAGVRASGFNFVNFANQVWHRIVFRCGIETNDVVLSHWNPIPLRTAQRLPWCNATKTTYVQLWPILVKYGFGWWMFSLYFTDGVSLTSRVRCLANSRLWPCHCLTRCCFWARLDSQSERRVERKCTSERRKSMRLVLCRSLENGHD